TVDNSTLNLQSNIAGWKGDLLGTLPIISESTALLASINKGTKLAKASTAVDFLGAIGVALATVSLATSVNTSLTAVIAAKHKFDKLKLSPVILVDLDLQKKATTDMSNASAAQVPADLKDLAATLVEPIFAAFDKAIDVFNPF
ncbi:hydrophobic surface binding protein A-domain-containing protein, partial [Lasiosphaeria miniovina]